MGRIDWKRCPSCNTERALEDFHRASRSKDGRAGYCKPCSKEKSRVWYAANAEHCREVHERWLRERPSKERTGKGLNYDRKYLSGLRPEDYDTPEDLRRALSSAQYARDLRKAKDHVRAIKSSNPCLDCGGSFHFSAMDFDHVRGEKRWNVSQMVIKGMSIRAIDHEISKCELVCSNCHRVRTWNRQQNAMLEEVI